MVFQNGIEKHKKIWDIVSDFLKSLFEQFCFLGGGRVIDYGEGEVIFEGEETDYYDCKGTRELLSHYGAPGSEKDPIDQSPGKTGRGIDVFFEDERLIVD